MKNTSSVFIRFSDSRGELLLRASAIDGIAPTGRRNATYVWLGGTRLTVTLPEQTIRDAIIAAEKAHRSGNNEAYIEITCPDANISGQDAC
ncbi:hypothetical protein ABVX93_002549 [Escherichia coli]